MAVERSVIARANKETLLPPKEVLEVSRRIKEIGETGLRIDKIFDLHYVSGSWIFIDNTPRPNSMDDKQTEDKLMPIIQRITKGNKYLKYLGENDEPGFGAKTAASHPSRFDISLDEITKIVFPSMQRLLGERPIRLRLPTREEFEILGSFMHPEWGRAKTGELLADESEYMTENANRVKYFIGGNADEGGLTTSRPIKSWTGRHSAWFRPVIEVFSIPEWFSKLEYASNFIPNSRKIVVGLP
jgi:hypothetical protein